MKTFSNIWDDIKTCLWCWNPVGEDGVVCVMCADREADR